MSYSDFPNEGGCLPASLSCAQGVVSAIVPADVAANKVVAVVAHVAAVPLLFTAFRAARCTLRELPKHLNGPSRTWGLGLDTVTGTEADLLLSSIESCRVCWARDKHFTVSRRR